MYCACQAKRRRGPAAATVPQLLQKALCTAPATRKGSANVLRTARAKKALCTAPATQKGSAEALCNARARQRQPRASGGHRAAAPPESSVYRACHAKGKCGGSVY